MYADLNCLPTELKPFAFYSVLKHYRFMDFTSKPDTVFAIGIC